MGQPFHHTLRVRFNECDPQGVVFNANYLVFFDITFTELFRVAFGSYADLVASGTDAMLVESRITYHRPARADELIDVELGVGRLGTTSFTFEGRIVREGDVLTTATLHYVAVDPQTQSKLPLTDAFRTALEPFAP